MTAPNELVAGVSLSRQSGAKDCMHPRGVVPCLANCHQLEWIVPSYAAIYSALSNPVYARAYVYGKTRNERYVDEQGTVRKRIRHVPQEEWLVFLPGLYESFIDWETFEAIQARLQANIPARFHQAGHALREGSALCKAWPSVGTADGGCVSLIKARIPRPATTVRVRNSTRAIAVNVSTWVVLPSIRQ